jgi:L-rhamnose mutarotase
MHRKAFKMKLKPGFREEYKRRHSQVWPELQTLLHQAGIRDYTIFLDPETDTLFAFQKTISHITSQNLGLHEVVKRWWAYMADIMETNADNSPVSVPLQEVFHLD